MSGNGELRFDSEALRYIAQGDRDAFMELMQAIKDEERRRFLHYHPYSKQLEFHSSHAVERILSGANQSGKAQPLDSLLLTPSGWVRMGDINVGDYVIGSDGEAKRVLTIHPQGERDIYKVTFNNGAIVRCDTEHLWTFRHHGYHTYTAKESLDRLNMGQRLVTPQVKSVRFNITRVPIDPYLLGLLLGDGSFVNRRITITNEDEPIIEYCRELAGTYNCELKEVSNLTYEFKSLDRTENKLARILRDRYDLMGVTSHKKFIPDDYKFNSPEIRLSVLQGLIDTDGHIDKDGNVEFYSVCERICRDVYDIAMSLGIKASVRVKNGRYKGQPHKSWRVGLGKTPLELSRLKRKVERQDLGEPCNTGIGIRSIEPDGKAVCQCITIDSSDSLYVTDCFILTHNSIAGSMETCFHLTGNYPDWWSGRRVLPRRNATNGEYELNAWVLGTDSKTVRDSLQSKIIGTKARDFRDGCIHPDFIMRESVIMARGVPEAVDTIYVKHKSGCNVRLQFRSYEQGRENLQSATIDFVYCDEEPPEEVMGELRARIAATGGFIYMAFTPLKGMTPLVQEFWTHENPNKFLVCMNIYEAKHMTEEKLRNIESLYSGLSEAERQARMMGIPTMGSGMVYPIDDEELKYDAFEFPKSFRRLGALDFGRGEHPTACVWIAQDPMTDVIYVYDCIKTIKKSVAENASIMRARGSWIPFAYPHDLMRDSGTDRGRPTEADKKSEGYKYKTMYEDEGITFTPHHARTTEGSNRVENGIIEVRQRMLNGKLKIARHLSELFKEKQVYRYGDDLKPVKAKDDLMDAMRYAVIMIRYGVSEYDAQFALLGSNGAVIDRTEIY